MTQITLIYTDKKSALIRLIRVICVPYLIQFKPIQLRKLHLELNLNDFAFQ